jgi:branched-chain amino acid transport system substrate-binding protein
MVREYQKIYAAQSGSTNYSYLGFEVFINAHVLATAIRSAGRNPSRETLTSALENMSELSVAPRMSVKYGPGDRAGSNYVGIAIIGSQGRFTE